MTTSDSNSFVISKTQCFSPGTVPEALHYFGHVYFADSNMTTFLASLFGAFLEHTPVQS